MNAKLYKLTSKASDSFIDLLTIAQEINETIAIDGNPLTEIIPELEDIQERLNEYFDTLDNV